MHAVAAEKVKGERKMLLMKRNQKPKAASVRRRDADDETFVCPISFTRSTLFF